MDIVTSIIYLVLFIVLMIFVFSMGLLTSVIEKKDILSVLAIGFIVGIVGGAFFITPIYQEIPNALGAVQGVLGGTEIINIELRPGPNSTKIINELNKTDGVVSMINKGVVLTTDPFDKERKTLIEDRIHIVDEHFKSFKVNTNGEISLNTTEGYDPSKAIKTLSDWLMYTGEINVRYSLVNIQLIVKSSEADKITNYLHENKVVIVHVNGSVQNAIENTENNMIDSNFVILITGIIGVIVALISIFFDTIYRGLGEYIDKIRNRNKEE